MGVLEKAREEGDIILQKTDVGIFLCMCQLVMIEQRSAETHLDFSSKAWLDRWSLLGTIGQSQETTFGVLDAGVEVAKPLWSLEAEETGLMSFLGRDLFRSSMVLMKSSSAKVMVGELSIFADVSCIMMEGREVVGIEV